MSKKVNVAQIGIGYWGPNLLRNLISNKNCSVNYVVDKSENRREYVKSLYNQLEVIDDFNVVMNDKSIDAVIIATPARTHFKLAMESLENDKNILVEKPMATTKKEVAKIKKLSNAKKLISMVGHTFIYNPAVRFIKKIIKSGEIGDLRYIYCQRLNLGRIRKDVDALWNLAPHDVSIIQYWLDEPDPIEVMSYGNSYIQKGINDVSFLNIKYANGIMAHVHVSWLDPDKVRKITVVGSKKMIVYDDILNDKVAIYDKGIDKVSRLGEDMDFDNLYGVNFNHRHGDVLIPDIDWHEPLKLEIDHFLDCIISGTKCITGADHAEKVVSILENK